MRISPEHIKSKSVIGENGSGHPIVMIETKGGLYACFTKNNDGEIIALGAAPHREIAKFLAEKRDPDIKWKESLDKNESLTKSEEVMFERMRKIIFSPTLPSMSKAEIDSKDHWFVYDTTRRVIEILDKTEIDRRITDNEIDEYCVVRPLDLSMSVDILGAHPVFKKHG